jgi:hypothetical protein
LKNNRSIPLWNFSWIFKVRHHKSTPNMNQKFSKHKNMSQRLRTNPYACS